MTLKRKRRWSDVHAMAHFLRCFPRDCQPEMRAILEQALRVGNLTAEKPWNVVGAHIAALRLAKAALDDIERTLEQMPREA